MKTFHLLMISILVLLLSCQGGNEEDMTPPPPIAYECEDVDTSLSGNVLPIIDTKCALSSCHVSGAQFPDFSDRTNVIQFSSGIRTNTQNGIMPPASSGMTLTPEELETIACWVEGGALDN